MAAKTTQLKKEKMCTQDRSEVLGCFVVFCFNGLTQNICICIYEMQVIFENYNHC